MVGYIHLIHFRVYFIATYHIKPCQLDELQKFVDGYIDIINLHNGDILVINDNGKDVLDSNETATEIAHKHNAIFGWDYICGDVVMCKDEEVQ